MHTKTRQLIARTTNKKTLFELKKCNARLRQAFEIYTFGFTIVDLPRVSEKILLNSFIDSVVRKKGLIELKKKKEMHNRVGSANFSRRKIEHARTITPRTLEMLQVRENQMCTRISFFASKTVREVRAFSINAQNTTMKQVNHKLSRRMIDAPSTWRFREASSDPEKCLVQHGLVEKKKRQTSWIVESFCKEDAK